MPAPSSQDWLLTDRFAVLLCSAASRSYQMISVILDVHILTPSSPTGAWAEGCRLKTRSAQSEAAPTTRSRMKTRRRPRVSPTLRFSWCLNVRSCWHRAPWAPIWWVCRWTPQLKQLCQQQWRSSWHAATFPDHFSATTSSSCRGAPSDWWLAASSPPGRCAFCVSASPLPRRSLHVVAGESIRSCWRAGYETLDPNFSRRDLCAFDTRGQCRNQRSLIFIEWFLPDSCTIYI